MGAIRYEITACLLLTSLGCGGGQSPPDPNSDCGPQQESSLEIGTGLTEFIPLQDGDRLPLVNGPQGGFHLELALRARGIDASDLIMGEMHGSVDGERLATKRPWIDFRCNDDVDALDSWGFELVYVIEPEDVPLYFGVDTLVTARVDDVLGNTVETSITLQITEE